MSTNNRRTQLVEWDQLADECRLRRLLTQGKARELADALTSAVALLRADDSDVLQLSPDSFAFNARMKAAGCSDV